MKNVLLLFALAIFSVAAFAQKKITVNESNENIGNGKKNALVVTIYEASVSDVEKEWKSLMKGYKAKVTSKKEIFADDALIKELGGNTVDVYAKVFDNKNGSVTLIVGFDLGGAFLNSKDHSAQYKEAKAIVHKFAVKISKDAVENQLKEAQKAKEKTEKEHAALIKEKENLEKDIENYKAKIKKAEEDIQKKIKGQEQKKKEIEEQQKTVTVIKTKLSSID
jgi:molecular chaperone DnaK (HSP70)